MIRRAVVYTPEAEADLLALYQWIADAATPGTAFAYVDRIEKFLDGFEVASDRGTRRDDLAPGLRTVGFERRLTIAFTVNDRSVTILRIFYGGQDWSAALSER